MEFKPDRLITLRKSLGINKAEAARRLNTTAMAYGRYENGQREPSFQTVSYIASTFGTTTDYLYGLTDSMEAKSITISKDTDSELFGLVEACKKDDATLKRLLAYAKNIIP